MATAPLLGAGAALLQVAVALLVAVATLLAVRPRWRAWACLLAGAACPCPASRYVGALRAAAEGRGAGECVAPLLACLREGVGAARVAVIRASERGGAFVEVAAASSHPPAPLAGGLVACPELSALRRSAIRAAKPLVPSGQAIRDAGLPSQVAAYAAVPVLAQRAPGHAPLGSECLATRAVCASASAASGKSDGALDTEVVALIEFVAAERFVKDVCADACSRAALDALASVLLICLRQERLAEAFRQQALFWANVAHELRTPLQGIIGAAELEYERAADERSQLPSPATPPPPSTPATPTSLAAAAAMVPSPQLQRAESPLHRRAVEAAASAGNLEIIQHSSRALLTVVNNVLDFAKLEADSMSAVAAPLDLVDVAEKALDVVKIAAQSSGTLLSYVLESGCPATLVSDPHLVQRVLINLLSNAVKFSPRGRVCVRVRLLDGGSDAEAAPAALSGASVPALPADVVHAQACEPRVCGGATEQECGVDVDTAVRAACACASRPSFVRVGELRRRDPRSPLVRISVEDSGQGISACQLTRLFQPFAQAAQARNRRHGGCGLGLVISAAAARRLGGYVEAISQPRRGSVFSLCFPVELADAAPASAPSRPLAVAVLENEPLLREALVGMLRRLGAEPRVFGGVDELRAALRAEREALAYGSADELKGAAAPRPPLRLAVFGLDSPLFALRSWLADADGAAASPTGSPRGLAPSAALVADMEWIAGCGALPLVAVRHAGVPRSALLDACGDLLSGFVSFPLKQAQLAAWLARAAQLREAESACACEPAPVTPSSSSSSSQSSLSCAAVSSLSCEPASALSPPLAQPSRLGASFGAPESAAEGSAKTSSRLRVSARAISLQRQLVAGSLAPRPGAGAGLPAAPSDSASPTRPLRVLVVDDNPVNRKIIVSQLRRLGHEPVPAASGLAAIKLVGGGSGERTGAAEVDVDAGALLPLRAPRGAFDVVFTDLQMPDLDGYETATAIREAVRRAGQPQPAIVGCSASIGADVERLCRESGMDDTFAKPFTLESLAAKLASFGPLLKQRAAAPPDANEARAQELARA